MDYPAVLEFLKSRDMTMLRYDRVAWDAFVAKIGLRIAAPFIHLTGTNGKGSTAHFLYDIYQTAGYKTALFSKPYLYRPNEMAEIDGEAISDDDFARVFTEREKEIRASDLSEFEIETYISFQYFNERKVDLAVIEVGMGGEMDSTNLHGSAPLLSIITTVSLEHTLFLGRTISEIARSKSGIVKPLAPVLIGALEDSARAVIRDAAKKRNSPFHVVDDFHNEWYDAPYFHFDYRPYHDLAAATPARYELANAALAVEATSLLRDRFPVSEAALRQGLKKPPLPCRMERLGNFLLDGAHNPEAIEALMDSLPLVAGTTPVHVLFAALRDKNIAVELPRLSRDVADLTLTTFPSPRARVLEDYLLYVGDYPYEADYKTALAALAKRFPSDIILITGSLAFAGQARQYVKEVIHP